MADDGQVIIIKKKGGHGGHHGGAWKVAYADFVTAMMALFIVLWLMNSSKPVRDAIGGYFRDPRGVAQKKGSALGGAGEGTPVVKKEDMAKLKNDLMKAMEAMPNFDKLKKQIEMTLTPEGLRIELMENTQGTFFENGKSQPTPSLQTLLKILAEDVGKLPNSISIEGHTDSKPFSDSRTYGNWELSADRANTTRRLMQDSGVRQNQVAQVRGYADQNPRKPLQPEDASNRRITLIIQYLVKPAAQPSLTSNGSLPSADELKAAPAGAAIEPTAAAKEPKPGK
jgi:chemotaxis protein MotB